VQESEERGGGFERKGATTLLNEKAAGQGELKTARESSFLSDNGGRPAKCQKEKK